MARRSIDVIRSGITNDIEKFSSLTMCDILKVKCYKAIGLVLEVSPIYDKTVAIETGEEKREREVFNVFCVNRTSRFFEWNIEKKYYCLVLSVTKGGPAQSVGFLVPKTIPRIVEYLGDEEDKDIKAEQKDLIGKKAMK